jgi:hypothetical protein
MPSLYLLLSLFGTITLSSYETITIFWARLVHHAIMDDPSITDFETFIQQYPILLNGKAINQHYSHESLWSALACSEWVEPDVLPLPA